MNGNNNPAYNPNYGYSGQGIDPNQIFGNPNRQPQSNQPWSNLPIFPNPTSSHASQPQQPLYPNPIMPQHFVPQNPNNGAGNGGLPPYQIPFAFGVPPPNSQGSHIYPRPTPSLLDQFLYNKKGGRRNAGTSLHGTVTTQPLVIFIISICSMLTGAMLNNRNHR